MIEPCNSIEQSGWLPLRSALWPDDSDTEHREEMARLLSQPEHFAQYLAYAGQGQAVGFIEVALRHDYVNGTDTSPVAFLEGIYVVPTHRRLGIARNLVATASAWAVNHGCTEFASDADLENSESHLMHKSLGFAETERVVYFRMALTSK